DATNPNPFQVVYSNFFPEKQNIKPLDAFEQIVAALPRNNTPTNRQHKGVSKGSNQDSPSTPRIA
ncbi:MAG TPA: hypothetical protein K8V94_01065, partial [Corynebacterium amycolatum]|nr:hypothetical protein [Corynebacterium amycolatum]